MKCPLCANDNPSDAQFCGACGANLNSSEASIVAELPMVGLGEAISRGFSNYFTFSGRATRAEYWWWFLFVVSGRVVFGIIDGLVGLPGALSLLFSLGALPPSVAVSVRRLHDINRTGWWYLLWLIPFIGWIVLFVWAIKQGDTSRNKYGPDPRQPNPQQPYRL